MRLKNGEIIVVFSIDMEHALTWYKTRNGWIFTDLSFLFVSIRLCSFNPLCYEQFGYLGDRLSR